MFRNGVIINLEKKIRLLKNMNDGEFVAANSSNLYSTYAARIREQGESEMDITLFVACYNEEDNIIDTLDEVAKAMARLELSWEVIIVDDASRDRSVPLIQEYMNVHPDYPLHLEVLKKNRGLAQNFIEAAFLGRGKHYRLINGDNVEDRMGRLPFLLFYLLCGIFATGLQWYFDPHLDIPVIGASGAIAGVLAAYFFLYPLEQVIVFFPPMLFHVPAIAFLGLWVLLQLHNATTAIIFEGTTIDVAWWAHLGGFVAGGILYRFFIKVNKNEAF